MENKANRMKDYSILRLDRQRFAKRGSYNFGGDTLTTLVRDTVEVLQFWWGHEMERTGFVLWMW